MRRSSTNLVAKSPRWTFVARQNSGRVVIRKVAVSELETARRPREKNSGAASLDAPQLATSLTKAFRSAVRQVKRANGRITARA